MSIKNFLLLYILVISSVYAAPEVYFSPTDGIQKHLIHYIRNEQESIKAAVYLLIDKQVVTELAKAKIRGVKVELIVDVLSLESEWSKVPMLSEAQIPVYIYNGGQDSILHHKFFIFGKSRDGKGRVWTGSYNVTRRANAKNQENVVILDDPSTIKKYEHEYEHLKKKCALYHSKAKKRTNKFYTPDNFKPSFKVQTTVFEQLRCWF